jgi:DNA-directed RNA polymerase specialized sigma24 family protein
VRHIIKDRKISSCLLQAPYELKKPFDYEISSELSLEEISETARKSFSAVKMSIYRGPGFMKKMMKN